MNFDDMIIENRKFLRDLDEKIDRWKLEYDKPKLDGFDLMLSGIIGFCLVLAGLWCYGIYVYVDDCYMTQPKRSYSDVGIAVDSTPDHTVRIERERFYDEVQEIENWCHEITVKENDTTVVWDDFERRNDE